MLYLRLSRDDGDKEESNSITGQRELLRDFIRSLPELREYAVRIDDGFTGSNFERPSFKKMLEDVKAGRTNCIIVKDLSRFGRNYLDAGEYIEKIFPFLGVRFIAVNDNYDSLGGKNASDELIIPFKNLINEAYCRDISVKVRTQLEVKRKSGQYIGAFAVYGYLKDEADKNRLVADEYAADVVRDIFKWKLEGMSPQDIAARLNHSGVLSPMEYKRSLGMRFATSFKANPQAAWSANAVLRILKNPVYTGILIQGKETTPSYKVRKRVTKPESEWAIVSDAHEAIVERRDFDSVQKALSLDTRRSPGDSAVQLFSGMVFCGECGASMVRKTVPSGNKKYVYYVCAAHKQDKSCSPHRMRDEALEQLVLDTVGGGGWYALIVEPPCNLRDAHTLGSPPEYLPDNGSRRFVRLQLAGIIRLFAVTVGSPRPDEIAVFLLRRQRGAGLSGNILAVNLVNEIFQRNQITVRAPPGGEGVEAVVDGNKTNAQERENSLQIVAGFLVVSAKAG